MRAITAVSVGCIGIALQGAAGSALAQASVDGSRLGALDEIVVTAEKREERLQDVPVPVTALSASSLLEQNALRIQDYFSQVPGLTLTPNGAGSSTVTIRGLTTGGHTNPTVGVIVDDMPFGTSIGLASRSYAPDIDPNDLERVEVLRGPQGTLYGAASLGGLLKFVTVDPSTERVSGRVQADFNGVHNGDSKGYGVRGAVNVPLGDSLAIRASAFTREDPGYIDDDKLHLKGVNKTDVSGGRIAGLWRISDVWTVKLSALLQNTKGDGTANVTAAPGVGDLRQVELLPDQSFHHDIQAYTGTVTGSFLGLHFTSISGYSIDKFNLHLDNSGVFGGLFTEPPLNVPGADFFLQEKTKKFSQEFRLSGSITTRFDWLLGAFYTHEDSLADHDDYHAVDPVTLAVPGRILLDAYPSTYAEYAGFADLTYHVTDRFDVQVGARESRNKQSYTEILSGPLISLFGLPDPAVEPLNHTKDDSFTYLLTPRFKLSEDRMLYARVASGYRPGGPNVTCILFGPVPCTYKPDKTNNYEIGFKGDFLDRRLFVDASVYYISWQDMQLQVVDPVSHGTYFANAVRSKSDGIELSVDARPFSGLRVAAWVAYNDAELTQDIPVPRGANGQPTGGQPIGHDGDCLPLTSRFSGTLSADQEFPFGASVTGFAGASVNYYGNRQDRFVTSASQTRATLPAYAQTNLRAGVRYDAWKGTLYVNNVTDRRGVLSLASETNYLGQPESTLIQPRTIGISVARSF